MRSLALTLTSLIAIVPFLSAQQPGNSPIIPAPGSNPPAASIPTPILNPNGRLDALLMQWESQMKNVASVWAKEMTETDKDKDGTMRVYKGEARFLKPNYAAVQLVRVDNPKFYKMIVSTGNLGYDYRPQEKKLYVYRLPPQRAGLANAGILSFIGGMGAAEAKARFDMKISKDTGPDQPFIYIDVFPKHAADQKEFSRAQLVIVASTMLPRRLWTVAVNGNETTYDLPDVNTKVQLKPVDFAAPKMPEGWELKEVPLDELSQPQPRIARPAAPEK